MKKLWILISILFFMSCVNELEVEFTDNFSPDLVVPTAQTISEGDTSFAIDLYDANSNKDEDGDGDPITYSCSYDTSLGIEFNSVTGGI